MTGEASSALVGEKELPGLVPSRHARTVPERTQEPGSSPPHQWKQGRTAHLGGLILAQLTSSCVVTVPRRLIGVTED